MNQLYTRSQSVGTALEAVGEPMADGPIDIARLARAILRYRWGILGLAFAITLLAGLWAYSLQPIYRASASLVLETQEANLVNVEQVYQVGFEDYDYFQTQFEILKSRSLAERVVRELKLYEHPWFVRSANTSGSEKEGFSLETLLPADEKSPPAQLTLEQLQAVSIRSASAYVTAGLNVEPVEYSYMVHLSFESTDARLAARIVNTAAQGFIDDNLENRSSGTLQATDWLGGRLNSLKENLRQSEQALQEFREMEGLIDIEGVTGPGGNELNTLSQRLQETSKARIEAQTVVEDLQGLDGAGIDRLMTVPAILEHPLVRELKRDQSAAQRKADELGKRYGVKHPKMIAAQAELDAANRDLYREVRKVAAGISREYDLALRNEQQVQQVWDDSKSEIQNFNRVEFQLRDLQREVEANRELYDIFFTRIKSVSETGGFEKPHARIVDPALVPTSPVKPNKMIIVLIALVLSLVLACAVAFLLDIIDNTIKSPDDVQAVLKVPLLGVLPLKKATDSGEFEQFWQDTQSDFAEAIRTIRTGVVLSSLDEPAQIIVVTSTVPGEGKSTVVLNLASALGQMENTLVIGADLRRPSLAQRCGLSANHRGLSHFVSGLSQLEECIEYLDELNLNVMPAGVIPMNPLEMISSEKFVEALDTLRKKYDRIVIDSAPLQAVSDALILSSYADSVIYVVEADSTSATQVEKGIARIVGSNSPLTGVVLNQFDLRRDKRMYGAYGYQSGSDYGYSSKPPGA